MRAVVVAAFALATVVGVGHGAPFNAGFCSDPIRATWRICDSSAALDARSADIVSRLTLTDKVNLTLMGPVNVSLAGLEAFTWWSEATHGVGNAWGSREHVPATNFPLPISTSCAFNRSLWHATGNQIGREARAQQNSGRNGNTFWAPVVNLVRELCRSRGNASDVGGSGPGLRHDAVYPAHLHRPYCSPGDPRWGRKCVVLCVGCATRRRAALLRPPLYSLETAGEDPFASGAYARAFVTGFQTAKEAPFPLQASATCKHFVANEYEGHREGMDVSLSAQDLVDSYLPPFQACVEEGQVSGIMCAYSALNGEPCCANSWLLRTLLRQEWHFDGYVTSGACCGATACGADGLGLR